MPAYSIEALDVVLVEVRRGRDLQSARLGNLRSTAGILIGTAGIASGLISSTLVSLLWLIPMGAFLGAAVCGLMVIWPTSGKHVQPETVFAQADGILSLQVRTNVVAGIIAEYNTQEAKVGFRAGAITVGGTFFIIGILAVLVLAGVGAAFPADSGPSPISVIDPVLVEIQE